MNSMMSLPSRLCNALLTGVWLGAVVGSLWVWSPCPAVGEDTGKADAVEQVWLQWRNGDRLQGRLLRADQKTLQFESAVFAAPVEIDLGELTSVRRLESKAHEVRRENELRVDLANGDVMFGRLVSIADNRIVIESDRHGKVELSAEKIHRLSRAVPEEVLFVSSGRLDDWKAWKDRKLSEWDDVIGGGIHTSKFGAGIIKEIALPKLARVQVHLNWNERPGFSLALLHPDTKFRGGGLFGQLARGLGIRTERRAARQNQPRVAPFHLTVWDDALVLETLEDFTPVLTLDSNEKELQVEMLWNAEQGKLWVRANDMSEPVEVNVPKLRSGWMTGVFFRNFGRDVEVEAVQVLKWNGKLTTDQAEGRASVVMLDNRRLSSPVKSYDAKSSELLMKDGSRIRLQDVAEIYWGELERAAPKDDGSDWLSYVDGTTVHGTLVRIEDGTASIKVAYAAEPIRCGFDGEFATLVFARRQRAEEAKSVWTLKSSQAELRGRIAFVDFDGRAALAWQPVGVSTGVPLARGTAVEIERVQETPLPETISVSAMPDGADVLYLRNGDVVPAKAFVLKDDQLTFRLGTGKEQTLDTNQLRAVAFERDGTNADLLAHPEWKEKASRPADIKREDGRIEFYSSGRVTNSDVLSVPAVGFRIRRPKSQFVQVQMRLFLDGSKRASSAAVQLGFYFSGREVYYSFSVGSEQTGYQQAPGNRGKKTLDCEVEVRDGEAVLTMDGEELSIIDLPDSFEPGHGIEINVPQTGGRRRTSPALVISNFRLLRASDPFAAISDKDKQIILQIPRRFRRRPTTHLLMARTGDLLRGRLGGFDEETVQFTVRTVPQKIPRSRLAGVLWLDPIRRGGTDKPTSDAAGEENEEEKETRAAGSRLPDGAVRILTPTSRITMVPRAIRDGKIVGVSPLVGEVAVAVDEVVLLESSSSLRPVGEAPFAAWQPRVAEDPDVPGGQ